MATITIVIIKRTAVGATCSVVMKRGQNPPSTCPYQGYNANPAASMDNGQWTHTSGGMRCSGGSKRMVKAWEIESFGVRVKDCNMLRFQSSSQGEVQIRMKRETGPEDQERKRKAERGLGLCWLCYSTHLFISDVTRVRLLSWVSPPTCTSRLLVSSNFIRLGVRDAVSSFQFSFFFFFLKFNFWHSNLMRTELRSQPINWIWNPIGHGITLLMNFFFPPLYSLIWFY